MNTYTLQLENFIIQDAPLTEQNNENHKYEILERYYNDLYKLFLSKLANLDCAVSVGNTDKQKLKQLLDELIYVKTLLEEK